MVDEPVSPGPGIIAEAVLNVVTEPELAHVARITSRLQTAHGGQMVILTLDFCARRQASDETEFLAAPEKDNA